MYFLLIDVIFCYCHINHWSDCGVLAVMAGIAAFDVTVSRSDAS